MLDTKCWSFKLVWLCKYDEKQRGLINEMERPTLYLAGGFETTEFLYTKRLCVQTRCTR